MKIWNEYISYLKDNPEGYWFKRKLYGFGWTPARWQGWVTVFLYIALVLGLIWFVPEQLLVADPVRYIAAPVLAATFLLLVVAWRTGEPPRWQWGRKHDDK